MRAFASTFRAASRNVAPASCSPLLAVVFGWALTAGPLTCQQDADLGRRAGANGNSNAPRLEGRLPAARREPAPAAEHGYANDVEAERMGVVSRAKTDSRRVDPGLPVDLPPHGQCRFEVSVEPRRLMPGASGKAKIVMVLAGDSVLVAPEHLRIVAPPQESGSTSLQIGVPIVQPPRPGGLAPAYRGLNVYDNWALVEIPVTMPASVPAGSVQSVRVDAVFDLHEGSTGRWLGQFRNPMTIECEVGTVASPVVASIPAADERMGAAQPGDGRRDDAPAVGRGGVVAEPHVQGGDGAAPARTEAGDAVPGLGHDLGLMGAVALLVVAMLVLLARRAAGR